MLLADWTSLHLDVIAQDRGLKRLAASLYDFDAGSRVTRPDAVPPADSQTRPDHAFRVHQGTGRLFNQ